MNDPREELDNCKDSYERNFVFDNELMLKWYPHRVIQHASGDSLLELGLGHGYSTDTFSQHFKRYRVIEGSKEMIHRFHQQFHRPEVQITHALFEEFETDERVDNIAMGFVLEHVNDPVVILERYRRFVKKDGSIFIAVPNSEALHRRFGYEAGLLTDYTQLSPSDLEFGHMRYFNLRTLTELVNSLHFKIKNVEGIFLKPVTTQQLLDLNLLPEIMQAMLKVGVAYPELSNAILMQVGP